MARRTTTRPLSERFWPKVVRRGPDDCWEWSAARTPRGYGKIGAGAKGEGQLQAHRVSWQIANGPIPEDLCILHRCDNRGCVNPAHLFLGTKRDNALDMVAKGRCHQQKKTHCPKGHEYSPENTYIYAGGRYCRACNRAAVARLKARRAA